jgi:hypothetical protein
LLDDVGDALPLDGSESEHAAIQLALDRARQALGAVPALGYQPR